MPDAQAESLVDRTRSFAAGAAITAVEFLGDDVVFVLGEEALLFTNVAGEERRIPVHEGGILCAAGDGRRLVTGGDDGNVILTDAGARSTTIACDPRRRWIDRVAIGGAIAWSAGKEAFAKLRSGEVRSISLPSSAGGLAFAPKGLRLAIARYNGVTLWFPNAAAQPELLEWRGSHLEVTFSPDGKFLITSMQEAALHGWRLENRQHMRMSGYGAKVRSMSFTADGDWLATGGSNQLVLWPFAGKQGPTGKSPRMLAPTSALAVLVACHPKQPVAAVGYEDGLVLLVRLEDGAEIVARRPGAGAVSALAWNQEGGVLAFGTEDGEAGLVHIG